MTDYLYSQHCPKCGSYAVGTDWDGKSGKHKSRCQDCGLKFSVIIED